MARGSNQREGRAARSESLGRPLPVGRYEDTQGLRNLFPASRIPVEQKAVETQNAQSRIMRDVSNKGGNEGSPGSGAAANAEAYAKQLADGMVNGDRSNGLEDYFPKGMSTGFINALAKSGYAPGPNDPDTIKAIGSIITARTADDSARASGRGGNFGGNWGVRAVKDPDGFRLEVYTEDYTGRDESGEKTYRSSDTKEILFIPHDEVSSKKFLTSPEEIYNSKSYLKAQALKGYLDSLLMTSDF